MSEKAYDKPIKNFLILLLLLMVSPLLLSLSFRMLRTFKEMPKILIAYIVLGISIFLVLFTVYFGFKSFKTLLNYLFEK
ncbi:hypothetical protein BTO06_05320 [Tenacibaculum sp. SZ-18]|uniref:DUF6095 family protein n=1 Tax=Tenacibaculum sp. SZ-18 TaxID=754423 RepID=UPI000C2CE805|nr:DUF6095 family protein [Tenacibaculum sp. SZ-18]AUC14591.1 hypothetical protein BTO06_05320 [Tenacibaculum sp. SZ-18]